MSHACSLQGGPSCSVQHNAMQPVVAGQPRAKQPMDGNGARRDFHGGHYADDFMEKGSPQDLVLETIVLCSIVFQCYLPLCILQNNLKVST